MRTALRLGLLVTLAALFECTTFAPLKANSCGNGVVENGEDCDTFARGATACRAASSPVGACRLDCSSTPCPAGWGCGTDAICRQSAGRFVRQPNAIAAGVWRISAGDFDGDHRQDLLTREPIDPSGLSKMRLHFFDQSGALSKTLVIPPSVASPTVVDVDGDHLADIVFSHPEVTGFLGGIGTMLGQTDRTLTAVAYPTRTFAGVARVMPVNGLPAGTNPFVFFVKDASGSALGGIDAMGSSVALTALPDGPDAIAGEPLVARVFEDRAQFPCEEIVIAYTGKSEVLLYPTCKRTGATVAFNDTGPSGIVHVQLTGTAKVDRGVVVADVNADGHLDLLVGVLDGMPPVAKTFVAYGTGGTTFKSDPMLPADGKAAIFRLVTIEFGETYEPELPLAVGDMNKDGVPDFVIPTRVLVSQFVAGSGDAGGGSDGGDGGDGGDASTSSGQPPTYASAGQKPAGTWTQAAIADFNRNGFPDAVAGSSASLDLDFFDGNAGQLFSTFSLATNGPALHFAVGDVDGDYYPDLIFAQTSGGNTGDDLAVAFGRPGGAPEAPIAVGRFEHIVQVAAFNQGTPLDNLGVVSRPYDPRAPLVSSASLLLGNGDREPLTLFSLTHPKVNAGFPRAAIPGAFAKDGNMDIVALAQDSSANAFRFWLMKASGGTPAPQFNQAIDGPTLRGDVQPRLANRDVIVLMAQGDVTGDGVPDVVAVTPFGALDGSNTQITIASFDAVGKATVGDPIPLGLAANQEGQLDVIDVDRDGAADIVVLMGADNATQLIVFWNDGKGGFDAKRSTIMSIGTDAPTGFTAINVGVNEPPALAYVTRNGLVLGHLDKTDRTKVRPERIDTPKNATGIVAADVNGDGVDDLAIADSTNLVILLAQPVIP